MSVVVFDFDGTLADSLTVALSVYNDIAAQKSFKQIDSVDWEKLRYMSIGQAMKYVGVKPYHVPGILAAGRRELHNHVGSIHLFEGIPDVINKLHNQKHQLFVLSTNSRKTVLSVLSEAGISDKIQVLSSAPIFGKAAALKKLAKKMNIDPGQLWMIGDELRDAQAAKKAGAKCIAVTWGLQPKVILERGKPTNIAYTPDDIVKILKEDGA